ncbi:MAG: DUF1285 domain-containing protein [Gemmobacter sp.]|nr:DUF1285 domain-containing protein [Gemmobacter sp.]
MIVKADANSLMDQVKSASKKGPPPVHLWNPAYCGEMDMRIARDGTWFHEGTPIGRAPLVKLFAGILKLEEGRYYLVTPVEKLGIQVEDAPFVAVDFSVSGEGDSQEITFTTNVGDEAVAGAEHPIRVTRDAETGEPSPYVMIRRGLEARIDRKSFYRLVDMGETAPHEGADWFGVRSGGLFFPMIPAAELA